MILTKMAFNYVCPKCGTTVGVFHIQGRCDIRDMSSLFLRTCNKCRIRMIISSISGEPVRNNPANKGWQFND
jgi:hypothetical protein